MCPFGRLTSRKTNDSDIFTLRPLCLDDHALCVIGEGKYLVSCHVKVQVALLCASSQRWKSPSMVDRNLIREVNVTNDEVEHVFLETLGSLGDQENNMDKIYDQSSKSFDLNEITNGIVLRVEGDEVLVDIGYKSEGVVTIDEWSEGETLPQPGDKIQVLLEEVEDDFGLVMLSKRKADRVREWEKIIQTHAEGDIVTGTVVRKIKGGLLVNIGVNVFLPASQVDIRRPHDIGSFVNKEIECLILKIDEARRNIVVSRRKLIEDKRETMKKALLEEINEGQLRQGVVKNIADFGAFVDLGGIDGLLHITDMSWGRISHPSDMVKIDDEIEVMVLNIDRDKEKIALGLKQKFPSPWDVVEEKYPVGGKVQGEVVNVMTYGAFVKLEDGIEGLVHISEMSWTKRISHPTELVNIGEEVELIVLGINKEKQEISLGMKQTMPNPWIDVMNKYPPDSSVKGTVRNLTNYGAFIELEEGVDGLLHVSDMSWTRKISHASEMLVKGDEIECKVLTVDEDRKRIALGIKQLHSDPWEQEIPDKFCPGSMVKGIVKKITNFGVFVELAPELEGLLHISELAEHKVDNPDDVVKVGEEVDVRILRLDTDERKIGLSRKQTVDPEQPADESVEVGEDDLEETREELKGGTESSSAGPLFTLDDPEDELKPVIAVEGFIESTESSESVTDSNSETDSELDTSSGSEDACQQLPPIADIEESESPTVDSSDTEAKSEADVDETTNDDVP